MTWYSSCDWSDNVCRYEWESYTQVKISAPNMNFSVCYHKGMGEKSS